MPQHSTLILIAAYNEAQQIRHVVTALRERFPSILVVDDGSDDATASEAHASGATVIRHPINLGQGAALATGLQYAREFGISRVVTFDADGQHDPQDIEAMLAALDHRNVDVILGSRFLGRTERMPYSKRLTLRLAVFFTSMTSGIHLTDAHNGLRVLGQRAITKIRLQQNRMAHASEFIEQLRKHQLSYSEHPVTIRYTDYSLAKGQPISNSFQIVIELMLSWMRR